MFKFVTSLIKYKTNEFKKNAPEIELFRYIFCIFFNLKKYSSLERKKYI